MTFLVRTLLSVSLTGFLLTVHAEGAAPAPAKADPAKGSTVYNGICVTCHGAEGNSAITINPKLAQQHPEYIAKQLAEFKSGKRANPVMMGFSAALSDDDMRNVGAYLASTKAKPGFAKDKDLAALGEKIYRGGIADRQIPACAGCHNLMDPVGFALEKYDAIGRSRTREDGVPVDATGSLPDGASFDGATGLQRALLTRPELFVSTLAEKLLTFASGRGLEYYDAPAIRQVVREAGQNDYRFSSLILGIVKSPPFQMRRSL